MTVVFQVSLMQQVGLQGVGQDGGKAQGPNQVKPAKRHRARASLDVGLRTRPLVRATIRKHKEAHRTERIGVYWGYQRLPVNTDAHRVFLGIKSKETVWLKVYPAEGFVATTGKMYI